MSPKWKYFTLRGFKDLKTRPHELKSTPTLPTFIPSVLLARAGRPDVRWGKYLQNVEPKSISHSTKISSRTGEGRLPDPRRPKSPLRYLICIPIVLTWLRRNSLRASEGEPLQAETTWLIYSREPHTAAAAAARSLQLICCCGAGAACAKKAKLRKKTKKTSLTFSPLCSNITLQCPTLIILYGVNFTLLPWPCLWWRLCRGSIKYQLLKCQLTSHFQKTGCLCVVFDYYIIIICTGTRSESNYALCNIQRSLSFTEITSVFVTTWQQKRKVCVCVRWCSQMIQYVNIFKGKYSSREEGGSFAYVSLQKQQQQWKLQFIIFPTIPGHGLTLSHLLKCFLSSVLGHFPPFLCHSHPLCFSFFFPF